MTTIWLKHNYDENLKLFRIDLDPKYTALLRLIQATYNLEVLVFWNEYGGGKISLNQNSNLKLLNSITKCLENSDETWNIVKSQINQAFDKDGEDWSKIEIIVDIESGSDIEIYNTKEFFIFYLQLLKKLTEAAIDSNQIIWTHSD